MERAPRQKSRCWVNTSTDEGLPPANRQTYRLNAGAFFAIRDGKVARVTNYYNLQDWIKQVGLNAAAG